MYGTYEIVGREGLAAFVEGDDHVAEPGLHILDARGQGEDGHDLRADSNLEGSLAGLALLRGALAHCDFAQVTVIDIDDCEVNVIV